jgi:hypothetical protein
MKDFSKNLLRQIFALSFNKQISKIQRKSNIDNMSLAKRKIIFVVNFCLTSVDMRILRSRLQVTIVHIYTNNIYKLLIIRVVYIYFQNPMFNNNEVKQDHY